MTITNYITKKNYECYLEDDGTLDTVISVNGKYYKFSTEYALNFREKDGSLSTSKFHELANEAIDLYEEELQ